MHTHIGHCSWVLQYCRCRYKKIKTYKETHEQESQPFWNKSTLAQLVKCCPQVWSHCICICRISPGTTSYLTRDMVTECSAKKMFVLFETSLFVKTSRTSFLREVLWIVHKHKSSKKFIYSFMKKFFLVHVHHYCIIIKKNFFDM